MVRQGTARAATPCATVPPGLLAKQPLQLQSTGERALLCQKVTKTHGSLLDRALPRGMVTELPTGTAGGLSACSHFSQQGPGSSQEVEHIFFFFLFAESHLNIFEFQQSA